jgi:hypothetical protein
MIDDGDYAKLMAKWGLPGSTALSRATISKGLGRRQILVINPNSSLSVTAAIDGGA